LPLPSNALLAAITIGRLGSEFCADAMQVQIPKIAKICEMTLRVRMMGSPFNLI
jgi:hypothetical protein